MSKQKVVYVVTAGEYDEYHIEEIFTQRSSAEKYLETHPRARIEERALDRNVRYMFEGWPMFNVTIYRDGTSMIRECQGEVYCEPRLTYSHKIGAYFWGIIYAVNKEHAEEIGIRMAYELIYSGKWDELEQEYKENSKS